MASTIILFLTVLNVIVGVFTIIVSSVIFFVPYGTIGTLAIFIIAGIELIFIWSCILLVFKK